MANSLQNGACSNDLKCVVAKKFPRGKPSNPIFARFAHIWLQYPKFLFQRASPYSGETAKKILLKDNLGSVSDMFVFMSIVMKKNYACY